MDNTQELNVESFREFVADCLADYPIARIGEKHSIGFEDNEIRKLNRILRGLRKGRRVLIENEQAHYLCFLFRYEPEIEYTEVKLKEKDYYELSLHPSKIRWEILHRCNMFKCVPLKKTLILREGDLYY